MYKRQIHDSIYGEVTSKLANAYTQLKIGDPLDESNHVGPLIDKQAVEIYLSAIEKAKAEGGNVLVEGGNELSGSFLKHKLFNQFYLFKSPKILEKSSPYKDFNHLKYLIHNYGAKIKISNKLSKDTITLYKN